MKLRKLYFDPTVSRSIQISDKLFTMDGLTWSQRLFLMEILRFQVMGGDHPYLSQSQFATKNKIGRDRVRAEIKDLIDRNMLIKYKQKDVTSACEFILTLDFLTELGYTLEERKKPDTVEQPIVEENTESELIDYSKEQERVRSLNEDPF